MYFFYETFEFIYNHFNMCVHKLHEAGTEKNNSKLKFIKEFTHSYNLHLIFIFHFQLYNSSLVSVIDKRAYTLQIHQLILYQLTQYSSIDNQKLIKKHKYYIIF